MLKHPLIDRLERQIDCYFTVPNLQEYSKGKLAAFETALAMAQQELSAPAVTENPVKWVALEDAVREMLVIEGDSKGFYEGIECAVDLLQKHGLLTQQQIKALQPRPPIQVGDRFKDRIATDDTYTIVEADPDSFTLMNAKFQLCGGFHSSIEKLLKCHHLLERYEG